MINKQEPSQSTIKPTTSEVKLPKNLFINERQALKNMMDSGVSEELALQAIKEKRIELWGDSKLSQKESQALINMANNDVDINQAVKAVKEKRYDDLSIGQKIGKNIFDLGLTGPTMVAEQIANVGSFIFKDDELKQQAENLRNLRKNELEQTIGGKLGSGITSFGEMAATAPAKIPTTLFGRSALAGGVGAIQGAGKEIFEKGKDTTMGGAVKRGLTEGAIGTVSVPVIEKVVAPVLSKTISSGIQGIKGTVDKGVKYGTALQKGGTEGLKKSVGRDLTRVGQAIKQPFTNIQTKLAPETAFKISTKANRFNAKDIEDFTKITGETPGEFAVKRGMTKTGDDAVEEATKLYKKSMDEADKSIGLIQGNFKQQGEDYMGTMLKDLNKRLVNTKSEEATKINKLLQKYQTEGLSMSEINEVKRQYARNFKYNWTELGSEKALKSKNIQDGVRKWQFEVAKDEGLENLAEINKNTQGWKAFADSLAKKIKRSEGNNAVTITDFIALSGGEPTNIALYLGKKVGGSKFIQEGLIKRLAKQTKNPIIEGTNQNIINRNIQRQYGINNDLSNLGSSSRFSNKPKIKGLLPVGTTPTTKKTKTIITPKSKAIITPQTKEAGVILESKKGLKPKK